MSVGRIARLSAVSRLLALDSRLAISESTPRIPLDLPWTLGAGSEQMKMKHCERDPCLAKKQLEEVLNEA